MEAIETADVVVVGAGPAGLLVAGDLAESGVDVVLLERRRPELSNLTRAFLVSARTLEQLDARGMADELVATGAQIPVMRLYSRLAMDMSVLPTRFPYSLCTPQYETEKVLRARAERLGVRFVWDAEVTGLTQDESRAEVVAGQRKWQAQYVVGADGTRSTVRQAIGEPFRGHTLVKSVLLADVQFAEPPAAELESEASRLGFAFHAPFGDGWRRVIAWNRHDDQPVDAPAKVGDVKVLLRSVYGTDFGVDKARFLSRFSSDERQVDRYRVGRVFLVGDAAHTHSPAAGQGMNTGLQDAANLGWRLAAAVRDEGPADVLDGYHRERHPVGRAVIEGSGRMMRVAMTGAKLMRALRVARMGALSYRRPVQSMAEQVSGISFRYPAAPGDAAEIGRRMPDLPLAGGGRLYEALRTRNFVLVKGDGGGTTPARYGWRGRVDEVTALDPPDGDVLVRPDGYVAATSASTSP